MLKYTSIAYWTDLSSPSARVIPLGAMAELVVPRLRAMLLIGRTELEEDELDAIAPISRQLIAKPFDYLVLGFQDAWAHAQPGSALDYLSAKHGGAVNFSTPQHAQLNARLLQSQQNLTPLAKQDLDRVADEAFFRLFSGEHVLDVPQQELVKLIPAAIAA